MGNRKRASLERDRVLVRAESQKHKRKRNLGLFLKEGFRYHHAEPDYLMLVCWLPETADTIPLNASHRVGVGSFVMNSKREVLVVQEISGKFKGTGVWKFPTGVVNEGEDFCTAAIREVKEETGIDTQFVEVLAFRQSHKSFSSKSDLLFICMLKTTKL